MKTLVIIAHAPSPNTCLLRDSVEAGVREAGAEDLRIQTLPPLEAKAEDVLAADGVILGTTENLGYMAGAMKDFFDRTYYALLEEKQGMPYGLYVRAGQDGTGTLRAMDSIVTSGLRWRPIQDPILCKGPWTQDFIPPCKELGQLMAAGLDAGVF